MIETGYGTWKIGPFLVDIFQAHETMDYRLVIHLNGRQSLSQSFSTPTEAILCAERWELEEAPLEIAKLALGVGDG